MKQESLTIVKNSEIIKSALTFLDSAKNQKLNLAYRHSKLLIEDFWPVKKGYEPERVGL